MQLDSGHNKHRPSSRFTGETFKQFQNLQLPNFELHELFDRPSESRNYFPSMNMENVIEKYKRFQVKQLFEKVRKQ